MTKQIIKQAMGAVVFFVIRAVCVRGLAISVFVFSANPLPTRRSLIKMFSRNIDLAEKSGKQFAVYGQSVVKIGASHLFSTSLENGLIRLARGVSDLWRAVSILTQTPYLFNKKGGEAYL